MFWCEKVLSLSYNQISTSKKEEKERKNQIKSNQESDFAIQAF